MADQEEFAFGAGPAGGESVKKKARSKAARKKAPARKKVTASARKARK